MGRGRFFLRFDLSEILASNVERQKERKKRRKHRTRVESDTNYRNQNQTFERRRGRRKRREKKKKHYRNLKKSEQQFFQDRLSGI
jgi:hypothetical protein